MKQLIIRRMTVSDLLCNIFYKFRYWLYRSFFYRKLIYASPVEKEGWELTFEDDFEEISWSKDEKKKWRIGHAWGEFHPDYPDSYTGPPELVEGTSCARFSVMYFPREFPDDHRTGEPIIIPFRKSLITTSHSFKQQYGRFECRCQIPFDRGTHPAFWLAGHPYPPEIDVFEMYGGEDGSKAGVQEINLHYGDPGTKPLKMMKAWKVKISDPEPINVLHEFAMEWSPQRIECFTNGVKIFRYSRKDVLDKWFNLPTSKLWLIQNHSINSAFVKPDDKQYYSEYLVDYIRAYKPKT